MGYEFLNNSPSFTFVICLRNPLDKAVNNYALLEDLLKMTVASLSEQTYPNVHIVVVCHQAPQWLSEFGDNVHILNVSGNSVFLPDANATALDKSLRWIIGAVYALSNLNPKFIMLMDADDYVNVSLADHCFGSISDAGEYDFYLINSGVQVALHIPADGTISFSRAFVVNQFDQTCGSCRVFMADRLRERLLEKVSPLLLEKFSGIFPRTDSVREVVVAPDCVEWLFEASQDARKESGFFSTFGRHINQDIEFTYSALEILGAAKGCGHGNHEGHRRGGLHFERIVRKMPMDEFISTFGLERIGRKSHFVAGILCDLSRYKFGVKGKMREIFKSR